MFIIEKTKIKMMSIDKEDFAIKFISIKVFYSYLIFKTYDKLNYKRFK
ncbi:MAG: hypothetical protein QXP78_02825 [Candidatus Bathyarchaeia archaeon]